MKLTRNLLTPMAMLLIVSGCSAANKAVSNATPPQKDIETTSPTPASGSRNITKAIAGEWIVVSMGSNAIESDDYPYITFVPDDNRFYASNGCNIINGDYNLRTDGQISFHNTLTTMKLCPDAKYATEFNQIVAEDKLLMTKFETIGTESYLNFIAGGKTIMTLRRANMDYLNGKWQVVEIDGQAIDDDEANIFIDVNEQKVHGNTGCNFFNGSVSFDPTLANSINFTGMIVTRMACYKGDQERNMLVALEETVIVNRKSKDVVTLLDQSGKKRIKLKRVAIATNND